MSTKLANIFFTVQSLTSQPSGHTDFSQSTEEIKPLTEEEKKAKLEELRQKAAARKAAQEIKDKEAAKKNEVCHKTVPPWICGTSQLILPFTENQNEVDSRSSAYQGGA